jgi:photosystem II stability/assembly factor-like uncharacterized protein
MNAKTFLATTGPGLARAADLNGQSSVKHLLVNQSIHCLAPDPLNTNVIYAGTQGGGVLRSKDGGQTWQAAGLAGHVVKSLTVSKTEPGAVFAGTKLPALFVSRDDGATWKEIDAFERVRSWWWRSPAESDLGAYIQGIALSPTDPNIIVIGIEAGAVVRTEDGGQTWQSHRPGALRDCHSLIAHTTNGDWMYEAGGTGVGAAYSRDGGMTWRQPENGLERHYGWACAADPARPEVWYASLSPMFTWAQPGVPAAHVEGHANAAIYRSVGGAAWQKLGGGLPQPLNHMAYSLLTDPHAPGHLYAGLSNGDVWRSTDHGDSWTQMPFNLKGIHRTLIML